MDQSEKIIAAAKKVIEANKYFTDASMEFMELVQAGYQEPKKLQVDAAAIRLQAGKKYKRAI